MTPTISVIIPVYNGSNYLSEALDSVLAQTYQPLEIIVVNDGSNDDGATRKVAEQYGEKIRYYEKENGGVATALNYAIKAAQGEYISWLSHDDLYCPEKLAAEVEALNKIPNNEDVVIYSDYEFFVEGSSECWQKKLPETKPEDFRYWITVENCLHGCTLLLPKKAFEEMGYFDETLRTTQDYDMWFRMAPEYRFIHIPKVLVRARSHEAQGTRAMPKLVLDECESLLSRFVDTLTTTEVRRGSGEGHLTEAYMKIAQSLKMRNFHKAHKHTMQIAKSYAQGKGWFISLLHKFPMLLNSRIAYNFYNKSNMYLAGYAMLFIFKHSILKILK